MAALVSRCVPGALVALAGLVTFPASAFAQEARISFRVLPFASVAQTPLVTVEMSESKSSSKVPLPSLTLAKTETGTQLTGFVIALPVVSVGRLTLSPRYGDQRLNLDFPASALSGMVLDARAMRGISVTTTARSSSWTLMLGQLPTASTNVFGSSLPRTLAVTGTIRPRQKVSVAPRFVARLERRRVGATETSLGAGTKFEAGSHLAIIADLGFSRNNARAWAHLATAGAIGQWSRTGFEASVRRGDRTFTLLGAVPFAAEDREFATGRLNLFRGFTLSGKATSFRPAKVQGQAARGPGSASTVAGALSLTIDRLPYGLLVVSREDRSDASHLGSRLGIEWHHRQKTSVVVRYLEGQETETGSFRRSRHGRLEVDLHASPRHGRRLIADLRTLIVVTPREQVPLLTSRMAARLVVGRGIVVGTEAELAMFRASGADVIRAFRVTSESSLLRDTALKLSYAHQAGGWLPLGPRLEARVTRVVRFSRRPG